MELFIIAPSVLDEGQQQDAASKTHRPKVIELSHTSRS